MGVSALVHLGALGLVWLSPGESSSALPPQVIAVELIQPPPAPAAPKPRPKPAPVAVPEPPKPAPEPEQIVLPEKTTKPKPKPKPKPAPKREEREIFREPEKKEEQSLEDLLAEMRGEAGEAAPTTPTETARVPSTGSSRGTGQLSAAERAWHAKVIRKMKRSWVVQPGFRTQDLETTVEVTLDASGQILGEPRVVQRSGNPWYDESVVRGLSKANPLPAPPEAGEWTIVFRPRDAF